MVVAGFGWLWLVVAGFGSFLVLVCTMQWLAFRTLLLSGYVEMNPGPETFDFCTWNQHGSV